jgi:hypothetical protein
MGVGNHKLAGGELDVHGSAEDSRGRQGMRWRRATPALDCPSPSVVLIGRGRRKAIGRRHCAAPSPHRPMWSASACRSEAGPRAHPYHLPSGRPRDLNRGRLPPATPYFQIGAVNGITRDDVTHGGTGQVSGTMSGCARRDLSSRRELRPSSGRELRPRTRKPGQVTGRLLSGVREEHYAGYGAHFTTASKPTLAFRRK